MQGGVALPAEAAKPAPTYYEKRATYEEELLVRARAPGPLLLPLLLWDGTCGAEGTHKRGGALSQQLPALRTLLHQPPTPALLTRTNLTKPTRKRAGGGEGAGRRGAAGAHCLAPGHGV